MSNITDIGYIGDISTDISDIFIPGYFLSFRLEIFGFLVEKSNTIISMYRRETSQKTKLDFVKPHIIN